VKREEVKQRQWVRQKFWSFLLCSIPFTQGVSRAPKASSKVVETSAALALDISMLRET
jgi:hypothetical protein